MALSHVTKVFGVDDMGVYKLTSDVAGTTPVWGTKVDVVGVKSMEATLETETKELRGDNTLLAADAILRRITGKINYAKKNFDVWAALTSALVTDSGTTPNQVSTIIIAQSTTPAYFKVEAQSRHVDSVAGDIHILLYKCIPANLLTGFAEEDYRTQGNDFTAIPTIGTPTGAPANAWMSLVLNETAVAIT
jgi:hypothetical protein